MPHENEHNKKILNPSDVFILFLSHYLSNRGACCGLNSFVCHQSSARKDISHKLMRNANECIELNLGPAAVSCL